MRTLHRVTVRRVGRQLITVEVVGDAFLRQMVRRMVAALISVGRGRRSATDVAARAAWGCPAFHGETAAAKGLVLWRVPMGPERAKQTRQSEEHSAARKQD